MTRWRGYYDVVILPPAPIRDYAIGLSRQLRKLGGRWTLGKTAFLPHISLYHIPVTPEDFPAFANQVQHAAQSAGWGFLQTTGFDMPLLMFDKPEWLAELCRDVVHRTVRYLDRDYGVEQTWDVRWFAGRRRELAQRYLERYGTPMFGMNFRPHITLSSFERAAMPEADILKFKTLRFRPDRLAICELGESHSCQTIVFKTR
jgi:hypothetical protein